MLIDDPRQANLKITKRDNPDPVRIGGTVTYTLLVENLGPSRATGVSVWDRLPKQVSFVSAQATSGTCSVSDGDRDLQGRRPGRRRSAAGHDQGAGAGRLPAR